MSPTPPHKVPHRARHAIAQRGPEPAAGGRVAAISRWLGEELWRLQLERLPRWRAWPLKALRVAYLAFRGFVADNCLFRASGLTYITVLALVPLLAFAFSVAKGFGAYETLQTRVIEPWIDRILPSNSPDDLLGPGAQPADGAEQPEGAYTTARAAVENVLDLVEATDFSKLGFFGLAILLYMVFKLLGSVERAFNDIWGVSRSRTVLRKLSDYVALVVITPILVTTGLGLFTLSQTQRTLQRFGLVSDTTEPSAAADPGVAWLVQIGPFIVIVVGLALVYLTLPNTRVRGSSALWGALVGGALTVLALIGHTTFQLGIANFDAIYAGFAAFPIFLVFIYFLWTTVLFGAEVAAAHQGQGAYRRFTLGTPRDQSARERLALQTLGRLTLAFRGNQTSCTTEELAEELGVPEADVSAIVGRLGRAELVAAVGAPDDGERWVLTRDPNQVLITDVLHELRHEQAPEPLERIITPDLDLRIDLALAELDQAAQRSNANQTLSELAEGTENTECAEGIGGAEGTSGD